MLLASLVGLFTSFGLKTGKAIKYKMANGKETKSIKVTSEEITLIQTFIGVALMVFALLLWQTFALKKACQERNHDDIARHIRFWVLLFVGGWGLAFYADLKKRSANPTITLTSLIVEFVIDLLVFGLFFYFVHDFGSMCGMYSYYRGKGEIEDEDYLA
jgi:hypothetical protein